MNKIAGIVLTGGKSSRFGQDKTFAVYKGNFFYQQIISRMAAHVHHIYVVKREDQLIDVDDQHITYLPDMPTFKGDGPLAGIYTAMQESDAEWFLVMPVDTPLVDDSILTVLMEYRNAEVEAIIPRTSDHVHPLIAMYHRNTKVMIKEQLSEGKRSMRQLLDKLHVHYVDYRKESEYLFANINTQDQYHHLIKDNLE